MTRSKSLLACFALAMVLLPLETSSQDTASQSQSDRDWEKRAIQQWTVERRTGTQITIDLKTPPYVRRLTYFVERADWSHDSKRLIFMETLELIRVVTSWV